MFVANSNEAPCERYDLRYIVINYIDYRQVHIVTEVIPSSFTLIPDRSGVDRR